MSVRPCVRPSTKSFLDFNEIWHVGRGRWVTHNGMQYDPIQGQGHEPFKVGNPVIFYSYLLRHLQWELATDHGFLNYGTISKSGRARFFIFILVFVSHDFELGRNISCVESTVSPTRGYFICFSTGLFTVCERAFLQRSLHVEALDRALAERCRSGVAKLHHAKLMHWQRYIHCPPVSRASSLHLWCCITVLQICYSSNPS